MIEQSGAAVQVMTDQAFNAKYPGAGGIYDPASNTIYLPQNALATPVTTALVLAHEGTHYLQGKYGQANLANAGGPLGQLISGTNAITPNPPSVRVQMLSHEAQAYLVESYVASELHTNDFGLGTKNGQHLSYAQTYAAVESNPLYVNDGL
jgi:hypothetical protein